MSNVLKALATITVVAASAMGAPAFAATQTVDSVGYTFSFDDELWGLDFGTAFSNAGNVFTFSGLDYSTNSNGIRAGTSGSFYNASISDAVTITAKTGYQLTGVVSSATGVLQVGSGKQVGSEASANAYGASSWVTNTGSFGATSSGAVQVATLGVNSYESLSYVTSDAGMVNFAPGTTFAKSSYQFSGNTSATGAVSYAFASQDTVSYAVAVSAVPEPETYALLLAGLGLMGAVVRRRNKHPA